MSTDTIRQYIARLPEQPRPDRVLHRTGTDRVAGSVGAMCVSSVFQPVVDRAGTPFGHQAFFRAVGPGGAVAPGAVLDGLSGDEAVVGFDRMCRTVHALNRFAGTTQWAPLFLGVDHRLLQIVPEEHGTTFQRILTGFGVLASRVIITLPAEAAAAPGLLENVLPSYRLRNFGIAIQVDGWHAEGAARILRLRPDYVRLCSGADPQPWVSAAREVGARLVITQIGTPSQLDAALRAGADLLQGFHIGYPSESVAVPEIAGR